MYSEWLVGRGATEFNRRIRDILPEFLTLKQRKCRVINTDLREKKISGRKNKQREMPCKERRKILDIF